MSRMIIKEVSPKIQGISSLCFTLFGVLSLPSSWIPSFYKRPLEVLDVQSRSVTIRPQNTSPQCLLKS